MSYNLGFADNFSYPNSKMAFFAFPNNFRECGPKFTKVKTAYVILRPIASIFGIESARHVYKKLV